MRYYQLAYLLPPTLTKEEVKIIEDEIISFLEKEGGLLDRKEPSLKRSLFYEIKNYKNAFLGSCYFFIEPESLKKIEKKLREKEKILRFLLISEKAPKKLPTPKKVVKPKKVELTELEEKLKEFIGQ